MKWLSAFVIPCIIFLGITFTFSLPHKVIAQSSVYTSATQQTIGYFTNPGFLSRYNQNQRTEYDFLLSNLRQVLASRAQSTNASAGDTSFITNSLIDFESFLSTRVRSQTNPEIVQVLSDARALSDAVRGSVAADNFGQAYLNAAAGGAGPIESATAVQNATRNQVTDTQANGSTAGKCTNLFNAKFVDCIDVFISWIIKSVFVQFAGVFLWATAGLFNLIVQQGVLNFSQWAPDSLYPIWTVIRQIVSLFVVFAGLWLGFMYIIGKGDDFKKYVPWIVMFALFVNFSYPITRGLIDISNVISLNIYASAVGTDPLLANTPADRTAGGIIIQRLGLGGLISSATTESQTGVGTVNGGSADILKQINSVPNALLTLAFILYACWLFAVATGILVMRTIALVFLIVASPILFVDSVIPKLGDEAMKLRKLFFSQLIVAPVFMLMLALTLKFLDVFNLANVPTGDNTLRVFLNLIMMLVMLHITLKVTKEVAGTFGNFMTKSIGQVGSFATTAALGVATGGTGLIARGTIGRAAVAARDSGWVTNNQNSFIGRRAYDLSNSVATSTFDARNSTMLKSGASKLGISMGMGSKFGYEAVVDTRKKDFATRYGRIQQTYKENVYDKKTGELLNKKGDVNYDGVEAATKFRYAQGSAIAGEKGDGAVNKARKTMFNTKENDEIFEKAVDASVDKMIKAYKTNPQTGKAKSSKEKEDYLQELKAEETKIKKIDPMMKGEYALALVETMKRLDAEKRDTELALDKQVTKLVEQHNARTTEEGRSKFIADIADDEVKAKVREKLNGQQNQASTAISEQTNQPTSQPLQTTSWAGQGDTNIPAIDRKRTAQASQNTNIPELQLESQPQTDARIGTSSSNNITTNFDPTKVSFTQMALARSAEGGQDRSFMDAKNLSAENDGVFKQTPPTPTTQTSPTPSNPPVSA